MSPSSYVVSSVLRETANLRTEELESFKIRFTELFDTFEARSQGENRGALLKRLESLLERVGEWKSLVFANDDLAVWTRRIEQAQYDKTITCEKLTGLERSLYRRLEQFANRLDMSLFHSALLRDTDHVSHQHADIESTLDKVTLGEEFELVEQEVESIHTAFEEHAFTPKDVDVKAIEDFLINLFEDVIGNTQLESLRQQMKNCGDLLLSGLDKLHADLVEWCIEDLLENHLHTAENKTKLESYLQSEPAIRELTDMLNAKSIRHWNWRSGEAGLPVVAKKNAEGKYCIFVEEDIIDMVFLHSLALRWSMKLKDSLRGVTLFQLGIKEPNTEELQKREYYLQGPRTIQSASCTTCHPHDMSPPLPPPPAMHSPPPPRPSIFMPPPTKFKSGRRTGKRSCAICGPPPPPPPPPPRLPPACVDEARYRLYTDNISISRLPNRLGCSAERANEAETQAAILRMLALDIRCREAFEGSAHGISANFHSFAATLPHETILAVLRYIGISEEWLSIFKRFLRVPLNMGPAVRGASDQVRTCTSGVPIPHGFDTFFGEAVMFCLDMAVHQSTRSQETSPYLLRIRDECHFVGNEEQCKEAQQQIQGFANIMALDVDVKDLFPPASGPGSTIGFVTFHRNEVQGGAKPGQVTFGIDSMRVASSARRIKQELADCSTIFEWVRVWNRTIGTYAPGLFGPLVTVFGQAHLEAVTEAYNLAHEIIFDNNTTLTDRVKSLLPPSLFPVDPTFSLDAWIHLPVAYGGLGVKNPYATLNNVRPMLEDPVALLQDYLMDESKYYDHVADRFAKLTTEQREDKLKDIFDGDGDRIAKVFGADPLDKEPRFPSLEQLTVHRQRLPYPALPDYATPTMTPGTYGMPYPRSSPYTLLHRCGPSHVPIPSHVPFPSPNLPSKPPVSSPDLLHTYGILSRPLYHADRGASKMILNEVRRLSGKLGMRSWYEMSPEERWAVGFYGDECFERFGGLEMWYGEGVPRELLKAVRRYDADGDAGYGDIGGNPFDEFWCMPEA